MQEARKFIAVPGTDKSLTYRELGILYPQEVLSRERKQEIFGVGIASLEKLFSEHGIETPPNLIDRILVLGADDFRNLWTKEHPDRKLQEDRISGFSIDQTNTAVASYTSLEKMAKESGISTEDALRQVGIHELLHTLQIRERWAEAIDGQTVLKGTRRDGMVTSRPQLLTEDDKYLWHGMNRFVEGFTTGLTYKITGLDNSRQITGYISEDDAAYSLIQEVGLEPVLLATYTKRGLRTLYQAVANKFGKYTLQLMFIEMGKAYEEFKIETDKNGFDKLHRPDYSRAADALGYEMEKFECDSCRFWKKKDNFKDGNPN